MTTIDALAELCPMYVGSQAIGLSLSDPTLPRRAFSPIDIAVSYAGAGDAGVRLPLEAIVTGPSASSYRHWYYRLSAPTLITWSPQEGGDHLVLLREMGGARLYGTITVDVTGDRIDS